MRKSLIITALIAPAVSFAQLGADRSTVLTYNSTVITNKAWERKVVMVNDATGEIFNDDGQVGRKAQVDAANVAADNASELSDAAEASVQVQLDRLDAAASQTATNSIGLALVYPPETDRTNLTFYVVKTETDGITDTQWVWCNWDLSMSPSRFVVYETYGYCSTNKFTWTDWSVKTNITVNGVTWTGCKKGTVTRPEWARGKSCLDIRNDVLGGVNGFDFGDLTLTVSGATPFTGFVTNGITNEVLYFNQGFCMGTPPEPNQEEQ